MPSAGIYSDQARREITLPYYLDESLSNNFHYYLWLNHNNTLGDKISHDVRVQDTFVESNRLNFSFCLTTGVGWCFISNFY